MQASIPGLSQALPERLDQFGEPVIRPQGVGGQLVDLFRSAPDRRADDPLLAEIDRVGALVGSRRRERGEESQATYNRFLEAEGPMLRGVLELAIQSPEYTALSDDAKREYIETIVRRVRGSTADLRTLFRLAEAVNE